MLTSHTVENYLKAIFLAQVALLPSEQLVPMGQLASALGVVPGTATTMVKALAESGLVRYEPYAGVRLTPAGEKLAARGAAPAPADRALPGAGDGHELDRSARRGRAPRACRLRPADRAHRRDAGPAVSRPAWRPDPGTRGHAEPAGIRHADDVQGRGGCDGSPRERSGQRVPALRRASRSETGTSRPRRGSRPRRRLRQAARPGARVHDRRACGVEGAGGSGRGPGADGSALERRVRADVTGQKIRRALRHHGQLVSGRGSLQSGGRRLSEHRGGGIREQQLVVQLHPGVAGRLAGAPVFLHRVGARQRLRNGDRRYAAELSVSGTDRGTRTAGLLAARRAW